MSARGPGTHEAARPQLLECAADGPSGALDAFPEKCEACPAVAALVPAQANDGDEQVEGGGPTRPRRSRKWRRSGLSNMEREDGACRARTGHYLRWVWHARKLSDRTLEPFPAAKRKEGSGFRLLRFRGCPDAPGVVKLGVTNRAGLHARTVTGRAEK